MSELRNEFDPAEVALTIISAEETKERADEIARYNLAPRGHGLVAFDASGEAVFTIAGHQFGEPEIRVAIQQATLP